MAEEITTCPIWGIQTIRLKEPTTPDTKSLRRNRTLTARSAGIKSRVICLLFLEELLSDKEKARLTTWIVDQWLRGNRQPTITADVLFSVTRKPLSVPKRADRLLKYIAAASSIRKVGVDVQIPQTDYGPFAWSECVEESEIDYFLDYLVQKGWLASNEYGLARLSCKVTVDGHSRVEQLDIEETISPSAQAFVAMWFYDSTFAAYSDGIEPAIREAGYKSLRIDQKDHLNKIDDEIIAEIRRSRFVVADFTQGQDGARGGVYIMKPGLPRDLTYRLSLAVTSIL